MIISREALISSIDSLPRYRMSHLCTPLERAENLRAAIQDMTPYFVPPIYIKREDQTGLAFGGNKARHMEFLFGHILKNGYDTVINSNNFHSNQARFIAAACAKTKLKYYTVAEDKIGEPLTGNLLLCKLLGAEIHRSPTDYTDKVISRISNNVKSSGGTPFIVSNDEYADLCGMIGFLEAGVELESQLETITGRIRMWGLAGRSIAGLQLYAKNRGLNWKSTAVMYSPGDSNNYRRLSVKRSEQVAELLGLNEALFSNDFDVLSGYSGPAYGVATDDVYKVIYLIAKTEGVILDPNYTGKSLSALIGEACSGNLEKYETICFIHSGGLPQVFFYGGEFSKYLIDRN